jgi:hypothetical protein
MSTRCNIEIIEEGKSVWLYHHHDGYPQGVGFDLMKRFNDSMKKETLYLDTVANKLVKDPQDDYEITTGEHGDIEYKYVIDCDNSRIICYSVKHTYNDDIDVCSTSYDFVNLQKLYEEYLEGVKKEAEEKASETNEEEEL